MATKESNHKIAGLMRSFTYVQGNLSGWQDDGRPPTEHFEFGPNHFTVERKTSTFTLLTDVGIVWSTGYIEAIGMSSCGAGLTTDEMTTTHTYETPIHIDSGIGFKVSMARTDDKGGREDSATGRNASGIGMKSSRTTNTAH